MCAPSGAGNVRPVFFINKQSTVFFLQISIIVSFITVLTATHLSNPNNFLTLSKSVMCNTLYNFVHRKQIHKTMEGASMNAAVEFSKAASKDPR
eukprot:m.78936 g.78936  ORF g.78936 m.78936 type:complete len:94 (+) comp12696_c0_seq2:1952-2233(+)